MLSNSLTGKVLQNIGYVLLRSGDDTGLDLTTDATIPPTDNINSVEDTVTWMGKMAGWIEKYAIDIALPVLIKLLITVLIFFVGRFIVRKIIKILDKSMARSNLEEGTVHFLGSLAQGVGYLLLIAVCANYLNFGTGPIVAVLGSAGLALGLSLQNSLANFAGGILLLISKPFLVGDYIIALGNEGVVSKMDIIYTTLLTPDNRKIVIPNGSLANADIVNVTEQEKRRVDITVGVDYESDIVKVKTVLENIAKENELVLDDEEIVVFVDKFDSSAITMGLRVWVASENYWKVKWDLQEKIKIIFDEKNISIPYDRVDIKMVTEDKE